MNENWAFEVSHISTGRKSFMNCRTLLIPRGSHISKASQQQLKSQPALTIPCGPVVKTGLHATHLPQLHPPIYHSTHHVPLPLLHTLPLLRHTWRKCRHSASLKILGGIMCLNDMHYFFSSMQNIWWNLLPICDSIEPTNPVIGKPTAPIFRLWTEKPATGWKWFRVECPLTWLASFSLCQLAAQYEFAVSIPFCETPFWQEKHCLKPNLA